jgi:SAM-dependent methyltransferase
VSAYPVLPPLEAYRLWAPGWDADPSAIVALESRYLASWLADLRGRRVLDVSCGTGRWLEFAARAGAHVLGLDLCAEMLERAGAKLPITGRLAVADAARLPVPDGWADIVLCTLSLGHMPDAGAVMAEMARTVTSNGSVIVSDFHPEAFRRGWKRTFRRGGLVYEIENHYYPVESLGAPGLVREEMLEPSFDEPEKPIFIGAGKPELFEEVRGIPAVMIGRWRKSVHET